MVICSLLFERLRAFPHNPPPLSAWLCSSNSTISCALCCQKTCLQQCSKCTSLGLAASAVLGTLTTSLLFSEVAGLATCLPGILSSSLASWLQHTHSALCMEANCDRRRGCDR